MLESEGERKNRMCATETEERQKTKKWAEQKKQKIYAIMEGFAAYKPFQKQVSGKLGNQTVKSTSQKKYSKDLKNFKKPCDNLRLR